MSIQTLEEWRNEVKNRIFKTALSRVVHTTDTTINKEYTTMAQQPTLTTDEALVLQQINEHGEDDVIGLEQSLRMSRPKLMAQLTHLKNKGLITVKMTTGDWWITVSRRGQQMMRRLWPEAALGY